MAIGSGSAGWRWSFRSAFCGTSLGASSAQLGLIVTLALATASAGALPRSQSARAEFQRSTPCPANGLRRGACPGWQVDHIQALKCGGRDAPDNMQWLTVESHREKTRRDMLGCRTRGSNI